MDMVKFHVICAYLRVLIVMTELNAMEIQPPSMDDSGRTKYPVLFRV